MFQPTMRHLIIVLLLTLTILSCNMPAFIGAVGGNTTPTAVMSPSQNVAIILPSSTPKAMPVSPTPTNKSDAAQVTPSPVTKESKVYQYKRLSDPDRMQVMDLDGHWLATFTDHAYTVTLLGAKRTFTEPSAKDPVVSTVWVRVLSAPFNGAVDEHWLSQALNDHSPDVLAIAMQYISGVLPINNKDGLQIAGKASYGPVKEDDTREEGGDFNDYLGIVWKFNGKTRQPDPAFSKSLDCSGFMRMVWGYRSSLPLSYNPDGGASIPRHSWDILASGPGVVIIPDANDTQVTDFSRLETGDLVFFHAKTETHDPQIDHVGMYLGKDTGGNYRFISSRQKIDGPTMGDIGGGSILNGKGLYASSFRGVRRL